MKKITVDEGYLGWQLLIILEVVIIDSLPYGALPQGRPVKSGVQITH